MSLRRSLLWTVCIAGMVLMAKVPAAVAIPPFFKEFQETYIKADADDEKDKNFAELVNNKAKCNVCHAGRSKKDRNAYGQKLAELLSKDNFKAARLKDEADKCKEEINAAFQQVAAMKSAGDDSPTFGDLIAQGKLPAEDAVQTAAATSDAEPAPEPMPEPAPADAASPPADNAEAIAAINQLGGTVMPVAMNNDALVVDFHLGGTALTDDGLTHVKALSNVYELHLKDTQITDAGLAHVAGLGSLVRLHLEKTNVTDAGLEQLKDLSNLEYLNLYGTSVTDAGLEHLKGLGKLQKLYLWQSQATDEGIAKLKEALPSVTVIK